MLESLFMASCEKNSISIIERRVGQLTPEYLYTLAKLSPGERVIDTRLNVSIADVSFENPVMIAPDGTNYESSVILALQEAGFGGIEIGSVPVTQSYRSNKSSRTIDVWRGENTYRLNLYPPISINCLKNIKGSSAPVGVNLSKNSDVSNEAAPEAFAASVKKLYDNTAYFVINVGSDTAGLQSRIRAMKDADLLAKILMASQEIMEMYGKRKPFFVKITHDLTRSAVDTIIDVVQGTGSTGIIAANHTAVRVNANNEFPQANYKQKGKKMIIVGSEQI